MSRTRTGRVKNSLGMLICITWQHVSALGGGETDSLLDRHWNSPMSLSSLCALGIYLALLLSAVNDTIPDFYPWAGDLNSGPHVCLASSWYPLSYPVCPLQQSCTSAYVLTLFPLCEKEGKPYCSCGQLQTNRNDSSPELSFLPKGC